MKAPLDNVIINMNEFKDKVLGCWTGKNIGGTLGGPFECRRETFDLEFYSQNLDGNPLPNDDLDLQLVWLLAVEERGVYNVNERVLGEYWLDYIIGPWNEYSIGKANMRNGLYPPLSGACNNDKWKNSNGAWIRSEVWACMFPGAPDEAIKYAYMDSCVDHSGDGVYAEIFTAALESAAFVVNDIRKLIEIGLSKIPTDCRIARSVKIACDYFDKGKTWLEAREALVKDSEDLGWFQAPANIGFTVVGLLYGKGDFGRTVCIATNCGDDTDCTAATAGAIWGIMHGRSAIPEKWIKPIGDSIKTVAVEPYQLIAPKTLQELTARVIKTALTARELNCMLPEISDKKTVIDPEYLKTLNSSESASKNLWTKSPYELVFDLPFTQISVDYENGPEVKPGEAKKLKLKVFNPQFMEKVVKFTWILPEGWTAPRGKSVSMLAKRGWANTVESVLIPGEFSDNYAYIQLQLTVQDRFYPYIVNVPFQLKDSVVFNDMPVNQSYWDKWDRVMCSKQLVTR